MDLLDYWRGTLSLRRLWALVKHKCLIPGTATSTAIHGEAGAYTRDTWFLFGLLNAKAGGKLKPPVDKVREDLMQEEMRRWRQRHGRPTTAQ